MAFKDVDLNKNNTKHGIWNEKYRLVSVLQNTFFSLLILKESKLRGGVIEQGLKLGVIIESSCRSRSHFKVVTRLDDSCGVVAWTLWTWSYCLFCSCSLRHLGVARLLALTHLPITCTLSLLVFISNPVIMFSSNQVKRVFGWASHWVAFECPPVVITRITHTVCVC